MVVSGILKSAATVIEAGTGRIKANYDTAPNRACRSAYPSSSAAMISPVLDIGLP